MKSSAFWVVCTILALYLSLFALQKINLATADLGRHIINGEILLNGSTAPASEPISKNALLHTNLFSYTYPDFPFINHHWGSGVVAYVIFKMSGFSGLSFAYLFCLIGSLFFFLRTIREEAGLTAIFLTGIFLIPLIADRTEVRPEGISYLFLSIFIFILYTNSKNRLSKGWLWLLPILEIMWVNLHIYFIFGPLIIGAFLCESLIQKKLVNAKKLFLITVTTILATLVNPFGLNLTLYPFNIFHNYGYKIVENQSIHFLENIGFSNPSFLWFKISLLCIMLSSVIILLRKKEKFAIALTLISLSFAGLAYFSIRTMTAFALVSLPLLAYNITLGWEWLAFYIEKEALVILSYCIGIFLLFSTGVHFSNRLPWNSNFGPGLIPHILDSAYFVKKTNIHGPIFNNYDIGSFLIFNFFSTTTNSEKKREKVFVDNRPEAYPNAFFTDIYIPMQENITVWQKVSAKENFNMIYFYRLDITPWAQTFLLARITDPDWAPVYVDDFTIIFLRRNDTNKNVIQTYELPKSMFNQK